MVYACASTSLAVSGKRFVKLDRHLYVDCLKRIEVFVHCSVLPLPHFQIELNIAVPLTDLTFIAVIAFATDNLGLVDTRIVY